jgi:hypothetical protein
VSTVDAAVYEKWRKAAHYYGTIWCPVVEAHTLLNLAPPPNFINIDVEGQSADIFLDLLNHASPACWCVEHDDRADELEAKAAHYKYRVVLRNGTNLVLAR